MTGRLHPSAFTVFRNASLLACFAVGVQKLVPLAFVGPNSLPYLHYPLISLVLSLADLGADAGAERLLPMFHLVLGLYVLLFSLFTAAFWWRTQQTMQRSRRTDAGLLAMQVVLAFLIDDKLLYLVAAELAFVLTRAPALAWLGAQLVLTFALHLFQLQQVQDVLLICNVSGSDLTPLPADQRATQIALDLATKLAFQIVTFCVGYLGAAEQQRRIKLAAAHAELLATQQLQADAAGSSERLRIARELHDAIGHHMTALNLHLDLAIRRAGSSVDAPILAARELARELFAEVRGVVSDERRNQSRTGQP